MKQFYSFIAILFAAFTCCSAQVSKVYITSDNKYSDDSVKAVSYILISKRPDSLYFVQQFKMDNIIQMESAYKDAGLTIQEGEMKVYYYKKPVKVLQLNYATQTIDTIFQPGKNYLSTRENYVNGISNGQWVDYSEDGEIIKVRNFKNGKLDGPFKTFGHNKISIEGQYKDGKQDGNWYTFTFKGDTSVIDYFVNGVLKKHISHYQNYSQDQRLYPVYLWKVSLSY